MDRNSTEYQTLVKNWAHGFNEFDRRSLNRVKEILNDFPNASGPEILEAIKKNEHFRDDYSLKYFTIHAREFFVAEENNQFFEDVMAEIEKSILAARP